jgi:hypothetical protein
MCFSWEWIEHLLILAVVIIAIVAMLQVLVPYVIGMLGVAPGPGWGVIVRCFKIFCWAIVAICVIVAVFMMIQCLWSLTGGVSLLPHR